MGWLDELAGLLGRAVGPVTRTLTPMRVKVTGEGPDEPDRYQQIGLLLENPDADATFRVQVVECAGLAGSPRPPWPPTDLAIIKGGFDRIVLVATRGSGVGVVDEYPRWLVVSARGTYQSIVTFAGVDDAEHCAPETLIGQEAHFRVRIWNRTLRKHHDWIMRFGVADDYRLWWSLSRV